MKGICPDIKEKCCSQIRQPSERAFRKSSGFYIIVAGGVKENVPPLSVNGGSLGIRLIFPPPLRTTITTAFL